MSRQDGLLCILFMQIIMLNTACENPSTLFKFLSDQLPPYAKLSSVQRKYFDEAKGNFQCKQNKFDSKAGTTARAIETLMGQYFD